MKNHNMIDSTTLIALDNFLESNYKTIRGIKAVADISLTELFQVSINDILKTTKRYLARYPADFILVLTNEEKSIYKCKKYAFSESGIFMLSGKIKSKRAAKISIDMARFIVGSYPGLIFNILNKEINENPIRF